MTRVILNNKPLIEAIFELHWTFRPLPSDSGADFRYKLLFGRLYDQISSDYPFVEALPTVSAPDDFVHNNPQYRFRVGDGQWPLVQLGPGVLTLNSTADYTWDVFEVQLVELVDGFLGLHPDNDKPQIDSLVLRYIDAVNFDYDKDDIFKFLREKMKINIDMHTGLFDDTGIDRSPEVLDLRTAFSSSNPKGRIHLRFAKGNQNDTDILFWETIFQTDSPDAPQSVDEIEAWAKGAHNLTSDWFFKIIEGDLRKRFE